MMTIEHAYDLLVYGNPDQIGDVLNFLFATWGQLALFSKLAHHEKGAKEAVIDFIIDHQDDTELYEAQEYYA